MKHVGYRFKESFTVTKSYIYQEDHPVEDNGYAPQKVEDLEKIYVDVREKNTEDN